MTKERVQEFLNSEPFLPFRFHMNDGTTIHVKGPEYARIAPGDGRSVVVWDDAGKGFWFVDTAQVKGIDTAPRFVARDGANGTTLIESATYGFTVALIWIHPNVSTQEVLKFYQDEMDDQ